MIEVRVDTKKTVSVEDMQDGHMYEKDDIFYICNRIDRFIAFSICGRWVIMNSSPKHGYTEVDAVISIRNHAK